MSCVVFIIQPKLIFARERSLMDVQSIVHLKKIFYFLPSNKDKNNSEMQKFLNWEWLVYFFPRVVQTRKVEDI